MKEAWWIDYLEGELNERLKQEKTLVLMFSPTDREIIENLAHLKKIIKTEIKVDAPEDPEYQQNFQNRIMAAIQKAKIEPSRQAKSEKLKVARLNFTLGI
mgnify:CR=1 FL=1